MTSLRGCNRWLFFGLAYGWTWVFWVPPALLGLRVDEMPVPVLVALGGVGPAVAAISLVYLAGDRHARRDFWARVFDFRRIGLRWHSVVFLTVPVLTAAAALLDIVGGGSGAQLEARFHSGLLSILPFAVFTLFFGPVPEELGWRGYALDDLLERHSALVASLILGALWTVWHLPLFCIEGSYQNGLTFGSVGLWWFLLDKMLLSIFMTWIYKNTGRSTQSAILFHFVVNFVGELLVLTERATLCQLLLWIGVVGVVAAREPAFYQGKQAPEG